MRALPRSITFPPLALLGALATLGALALGTLSPLSTGADNLLRLDIPQALPAQSTTATLTLADAQPIRGFDLTLAFAPARLLSSTAADFARNAAYIPPTPFGEHDLNSVRDTGPGRIRIVALAPMTATGQVEIGRLMMRVAQSAPLGATQTVTLSGEINIEDQGVVAIEPVVAVFRVGEPPPATATTTAVATSPTATTATSTLTVAPRTLTATPTHSATPTPLSPQTATATRDARTSTPPTGSATPTPGNRIFLSWAARNAGGR